MNFKILITDLHNTLYEEIIEYGASVQAAIDIWIKEGKEKGFQLDEKILKAELSESHRQLVSDWDEEAWNQIPSLQQFSSDDFQRVRKKAVERRAEMAREWTVRGSYSGLLEVFSELKKEEVYICILTEATLDGAVDRIHWLGLDSSVDHLYAWPTRHFPLTQIYPSSEFLKDPLTKRPLRKPHPFLIAQSLYDFALKKKLIDSQVSFQDCFEIKENWETDFSELGELDERRYCRSTLLLKKEYRFLFEPLLSQTVYLGDSLFKDGLLAQNGGVRFAWAKYGKEIASSLKEKYDQSMKLLLEVTGWDQTAMQWTQAVSGENQLAQVKPDYVLESLPDLLKIDLLNR